MSDPLPVDHVQRTDPLESLNKKLGRAKKFARSNCMSLTLERGGYTLAGRHFVNHLASIEEVDAWCIGYVAAFAALGLLVDASVLELSC